MNTINKKLEKINFSTKKPKNFNIINKNINSILVLEFKDTISITGATSGIGAEVLKKYEENGKIVLIIGSRSEKKLQQITENFKGNANYIGGDLFEKGTNAYNYYINNLPKEKKGGVEHIIASINMDREYVILDNDNNIVTGNIDEYIDEKLNIKEEYKNDFKIIKDYYDPRTGNKQKWNNKELESELLKEETLDTKKSIIRKEIADKQINFWEKMLKGLSEGEKKDTPLVITYANSIGSKFYENHSVKKAGSEYGRLKKEISEISRKYYDKLIEKNIYIKNIIIPVVDSEMWTNRSELNGKLTGNIVDGIGSILALDSKPILSNKALKAGDVANFFYEVGQSNPLELPSTIILLDEDYLDINEQKKIYKKDKIRIINEISNSKIRVNNNQIDINEVTKIFLINLRKEALKKYIINEESRIKNQKISDKQKKFKLKMLKKIADDNNSNIIEGNKIINGLENKISYESFIEICLILEKNYP